MNYYMILADNKAGGKEVDLKNLAKKYYGAKSEWRRI